MKKNYVAYTAATAAAVIVLTSSLGTSCVAACFTDDFNRADSTTVGNGWSAITGNSVVGQIEIKNNEVTSTTPDGDSGTGIYRLFSFNSSVTISATVKEENGYGGLLRRYTSGFRILSDGTKGSGYGIGVGRGDQNYNNSSVSLFDGTTLIGTQQCTFQYGPEIGVSVTFNLDGSVTGTITDTGQSFAFSFGPQTIQSNGQNVSWETGSCDSRASAYTFPRMDNFSICGSNIAPVITSGPTATPNPVMVNQSVSFSAAASDTDGDTITYAWDFGDGNMGSGSSTLHTYVSGGTYTVGVTVSDGNGGSDAKNLTVNVGLSSTAILQGIDVSSSARKPSSDVWQSIRTAGNAFVVVEAWAGRGKNTYAKDQLEGARVAKLKTAAYCLLNFDNSALNGPVNQDGGWQVEQALAAIGSEVDFISFLAIDVESAFPLKLKLDSRTQRITEAIQAANTVGLKAVIYVRRDDWRKIAGNTSDFSKAGVPLWQALGDYVADLTLDGKRPWKPFGGWVKRQGKQYVVDTPGKPITLLGIPVDKDVFDSSLF